MLIYKYYIHYKFTNKKDNVFEGGREVEMPRRISGMDDVLSVGKALAGIFDASPERMLIISFTLLSRRLNTNLFGWLSPFVWLVWLSKKF